MLELFFHVHLGHHLLLLPLPSPMHLRPPQHPGGGEPGVLQNLSGGEALGGLPAQYGADQALGLRRQRLWDVEVAPADFAEQRSRLDVVERVAPHQDGVKHDAEAPHIGRLARIAAVGVEDLGANVGRAAMFVRERIIMTGKDVRVLQALQLYEASTKEKGDRTTMNSLRKETYTQTRAIISTHYAKKQIF